MLIALHKQARTTPAVRAEIAASQDRQALSLAMQHGEFNIHGWRRADLLKHIPLSATAMSRQLRRLRLLGLIKKVTHSYRYYLTRLGRAVIATANAITRFQIVPAMAAAH